MLGFFSGSGVCGRDADGRAFRLKRPTAVTKSHIEAMEKSVP
jgi:hypothetical protein